MSLKSSTSFYNVRSDLEILLLSLSSTKHNSLQLLLYFTEKVQIHS